MKITYEEYLLEPKSISIEKMHLLHKQILDEICGDNEAEELYGDLIECATRYVDFRANWFLWDRETRIERDASRTSCHNSLIVKFNMLARYLHLQGKHTAWRDDLGYETDDKYTRKTIGDFACYLVFINSIHAR